MNTPTFTTIRTVVLFVGGLAGIAHQTLVENTDRPTLIVLFAAMIGLPAFLGKDEATRATNRPTPPRADGAPEENAK